MEVNKLLRRKQKAENENNQAALAEACGKLGHHFMNESRLRDALGEFRQQSDIHQTLCEKMEFARANRMIGEVFMLMGNYQEALKHEDVYMKIAKQENNLVEMQRAYATVGRCYLLQAEDKGTAGSKDAPIDFKAAEKAFLKSLIICKELTGSVTKYELADMQARLYLNLGVTKENTKHFDEAINYYETAIKVCRSNELFELHHQCLIASGFSYSIRKDDDVMAQAQFNAALEVAKRIQDKHEKTCETLLAKSVLFVKNADFQSAKQVLKRAYKLKSPDKCDGEQIMKNLKVVLAMCKHEDELITTDSFNYLKRKELFEKLGDGACRLKNFSKGIDFYLKMLEAAQLNGESDTQMIPIYVSLYQTYIDSKEYDAALKYMNKEYELVRNEPKEACVTLLGIGNLLDLAGKDFWEVDAIYRRGLLDARAAEDVTIEKTLMQKLIQLCKKRSMFSLAEDLEVEATAKGFELTEPSSEDVDFSEDIVDNCIDTSLELLLSSDPESSDDEKVRESKTSGVSTRKKRPAMTVKKNVKGETKLHEACINGNFQLAKMLIDQGHAVNVRDNAGWLPLHEAAIHGFRDVVELLLDNGAQSSINDKGGTSCEGITPLYDAASNGNLSVVQILLDRGAKTTVRTDYNETPLDALHKWHGTYGHKLSSTEGEFYEEIKQRLTEQCERVGIETAPKELNSLSSGYNSARSRKSQSSQKMKSLRYNTSFSSESENEEESARTSSAGNSVEKNARSEYKNVMERLKNPHKDAQRTVSSDPGYKRRSAHLSIQEVTPDEWLDDDLAPTKKKQRFFDQNPLDRSKSPTKLTTPIKSLSRNPSNVTNIDSESDCENNDFNVDAFDVVMSATSGLKTKSNRRISMTKAPKKTSSQPSLLDSGFSRFMDVVDLNNKSPVKARPQTSTLSESFSKPIEKQLIIKVQVEGEKIIVPVNKDAADELQISWLIDEAARRYYCLKGIKPELKLRTADGATLLNTDPVSLILSLTDENLIHSDILDWKLPSLSKRYFEACSEFKCPVDHELNEILEINRSATSLDLSNQNLNPSTVRPILKALQHQSCLVQLDLSNNFLQNDGIKFLSQTLTTMKQIRVLDVSGNLITESGVEHLCNVLEKELSLVELKQLKMSFNPIKSLKFISGLCHSKSVESLSMAGCELTDATRLEQLKSLKAIDISYNFLNNEAFKTILRSLNSDNIETLTIERCSTEQNLGGSIALFVNCCFNLRAINLAGLNFNENEILEIIRALEKCDRLESLDLSNQKQLSFLTLKYLMFNMENRSLAIVKLIGCRNLQSVSNMLHFNQNDAKLNQLRSFQLSLPNDASRDDFIEGLKALWDVVTAYRGRTNHDKSILHLIPSDDEREANFQF